MSDTETVERCYLIAALAHYGQCDKAGQAYIRHPERVAAAFPDDLDARAVAWLHDVVEDSPFTLEMLTALGIPGHIVAAVDALTHQREEPRLAYYERVRSNPLAKRVKLADVADNADEARLSKLDPQTAERLRRKYVLAATSLADEATSVTSR